MFCFKLIIVSLVQQNSGNEGNRKQFELARVQFIRVD